MQSTQTIPQRVRAAKAVGVPLVAITTPDQQATIHAICEFVNGDTPKVQWDILKGLRPINDEGAAAIAETQGDIETTKGSPVGLLQYIEHIPADTLVFAMNFHKIVATQQQDPPLAPLQAVSTLRDEFKKNNRMLIMLAPGMVLPPELKDDVLLMDEPLPTQDKLTEIINDTVESASSDGDGGKIDLGVTEDTVKRGVAAIAGLPAFAAEQAVALSLSRKGLDLGGLWDRKCSMINQTPGLQVYRGAERFEDIGGVSQVKVTLQRLLTGRGRPNAVVWVDEIEKMLAGSKGDTSGVSQDQLGSLLTYMEDHKCFGNLFLGAPGVAKSMVAKASGSVIEVPVIRLDLGACKGSLVGQSETMIRAMLKVVTAIGSDNTLWIATSNQDVSLDSALQRRFPMKWYFDLPDRAEKDLIWAIWRKKFEIDDDQTTPQDAGWVGANIQKCCEMAWRLDITLTAAGEYIVPVGTSAKDEIEKLRARADGKYLNASAPGMYRAVPKQAVQTKTQRRVETN